MRADSWLDFISYTSHPALRLTCRSELLEYIRGRPIATWMCPAAFCFVFVVLPFPPKHIHCIRRHNSRAETCPST
jgi:hypothetical protein